MDGLTIADFGMEFDYVPHTLHGLGASNQLDLCRREGEGKEGIFFSSQLHTHTPVHEIHDVEVMGETCSPTDPARMMPRFSSRIGTKC